MGNHDLDRPLRVAGRARSPAVLVRHAAEPKKRHGAVPRAFHLGAPTPGRDGLAHRQALPSHSHRQNSPPRPLLPAVSGPGLDQGEGRHLGSLRADPPRHRALGGRRQFRGDGEQRVHRRPILQPGMTPRPTLLPAGGRQGNIGILQPDRGLRLDGITQPASAQLLARIEIILP